MMTFQVIMEKAKESWTRLWDQTDMTPFFSSVKRFLDLFNPESETGSAMAMVFKSGVEGASKLASAILDDAGPAIMDLSVILLDLYSGTAPLLFDIAKMFKAIAGEAIEAARAVAKVLNQEDGYHTLETSNYGRYQGAIGAGVGKFVGGDTGASVGRAIGGLTGQFSQMITDPSGWSEEWTVKAIRALGLYPELFKEKGEQAGKAVGEGFQDGYKKEMQIHSPSKLMERLGEYTAEGLGIGASKRSGDASSSLAAGMQGAAPEAMPSQGSSGSRASVVVEAGAIVINASSGQSPRAISEEVLSRLMNSIAANQGVLLD
jgi:hypothetical protein